MSNYAQDSGSDSDSDNEDSPTSSVNFDLSGKNSAGFPTIKIDHGL